MNNIDKSVKFGYFQVETNDGVGYVCVALRRPAKNAQDRTYKAAFSFCSPKDGVRFEKRLARHIATQRLNANSHCVSEIIEEEQSLPLVFFSVLDLASKEIMTKKSNDGKSEYQATIAPNWVGKALKKERVKFGLTQEQHSDEKAEELLES